MLGGLAVHANVETRDTEVGNRARKRRLDLQSAAVSIHGLLGLAAVGQSGTEAVPKKVVLHYQPLQELGVGNGGSMPGVAV